MTDEPQNTIQASSHVDDLLVTSEDEAACKSFLSSLATRFGPGKAGPAEWYLKIQIVHLDTHVWMGQPDFTNQILKFVGLHEYSGRAYRSPMSSTWKHEIHGIEGGILDPVGAKAFGSINMTLSYLAQRTRSDIACEVNVLSQHQVQPYHGHFLALIRICKYLVHTRTLGLAYKKNKTKVIRGDDGKYFLNRAEHKLVIYADASWAEEPGRKSRTGIIVMFNGTAIAWLSQKQTLPAASSTEAEIYALSEATRLGLWFLQMMNEAHISGLDYFVVMQDNEATIKVAENPSSTQRTKHIDVRHNIINESITSGQMVLQHVFSSQMWADFQRKPLPVAPHEETRFNIGMRSLDELQRAEAPRL